MARITKDLKVTCDFLKEGFFLMESYEADKIFKALNRNGLYEKGEYAEIYSYFSHLFKMARNQWRDKRMTEGDYPILQMNVYAKDYAKLRSALSVASVGKGLQDWEEVEFMDAVKFLDRFNELMIALVEKEDSINSVWHDLSKL